jgi:hypothetical protein
VEFVSFLIWLAPAVAGAFLIAIGKAATGGNVQWPQHLDQLGLFSGHLSATLLYAPLWGFPAIVAAFPLRLILLNNGWFGWASALIAGAIAGIAVPVMLGLNLSPVGPLYGANYLWMQYIIYKARYPAFDAP